MARVDHSFLQLLPFVEVYEVGLIVLCCERSTLHVAT